MGKNVKFVKGQWKKTPYLAPGGVLLLYCDLPENLLWFSEIFFTQSFIPTKVKTTKFANRPQRLSRNLIIHRRKRNHRFVPRLGKKLKFRHPSTRKISRNPSMNFKKTSKFDSQLWVKITKIFSMEKNLNLVNLLQDKIVKFAINRGNYCECW